MDVNAGARRDDPTRTPAAQGTARDEDRDGHSLGFRNRHGIGEVVDVPVIERHNNPWPPRRNGQFVKGRRLVVQRNLVELRSKIGRAHAEWQRVIDFFIDPVIAENQGLATFHDTVATQVGSSGSKGQDERGQRVPAAV